MRDERGFHTDTLAIGVARRAMLGGGRAVEGARARARRRRIWWTPRPTKSSRCSRDGQGPRAASSAQRVRWRLETPLSAAPAQLGHPPSPPPPAEWLPPAAARLQRITTLVMSLMFDVHEAPAAEAARLKGFPVSPGVYEGPVRVIKSIEELPDVQQGEVLVATSDRADLQRRAAAHRRAGHRARRRAQPRGDRVARVRAARRRGMRGRDEAVADRDARARGRGHGRSMDAEPDAGCAARRASRAGVRRQGGQPRRGASRRTAGASRRGARRGVRRSRGGG